MRNTPQSTANQNARVTSISVTGNEGCAFYDGSKLLRVFGVVRNIEISRDRQYIVITQLDESRFSFDVWRLLAVGAVAYAPLNKFDPNAQAQYNQRIDDIFYNLSVRIFKSCCDCTSGSTPSPSFAYEWDSSLDSGDFYFVSGVLFMSPYGADGQYLGDLLSVLPEGSWITFMSQEDATSYVVYEVSDYQIFSGIISFTASIVSGSSVAFVEETLFNTQFDKDTTGGGGGAVDSVNGQTGVVVLDAADVGADPAGSAAAAEAAANAYTDAEIAAIDLQSVTNVGASTTNPITIDGDEAFLRVRGAGAGEMRVGVTDSSGTQVPYARWVGSNTTELRAENAVSARLLQLPDGDGPLVLTVNGAAADNQGNVSTSGIGWSTVTADGALVPNTGIVADKGTLLTMVVPAIAPFGSVFELVGMGAGGWLISQNINQMIHFGNQTTTVGIGGSIASTHIRDTIRLVCTVADLEFTVTSSIGTLNVT